ncbi:MAG: transcriptional repressor NrdR [bacterium]|nr:transcriptional repressor NrdR [bacterium]
MICPFCGHNQDSVIESRYNEKDNVLRRRRGCGFCGKRFTTYEKIESPVLWVVKRDSSREVFDRNKLKEGVMRACNKRPISLEAIDQLVDKVEQELLKKESNEVSSRQVGGAVLRRLRRLDEVAYIRFASVYLDFNSVNDFAFLIKKLDGGASRDR